jgi:LysM repeat protein
MNLKDLLEGGIIMRSTVWSLVGTIAVGVLIGLAAIVLSPAQVTHADGGCASTYTVQRGDTLVKIAGRLGVTYSELLLANQGGIANPNILFVGQVICLPEDLGAYKIALEAGYAITSTSEEGMVGSILGNGRLGKRVEYPLQSIGALQVFSDTASLMSALAAGPAPVLVGVRNNPSGAEDYTLVAIGRSDILTSLMISDTITITPSTSGPTPRPLSVVLQAPLVKPTSLALWLETEEGVRRPYVVTNLDFVQNFQDFKAAYAGPVGLDGKCKEKCIDFALFPASADRYSAILRLASSVNGPVQSGATLRCNSWKGKRGVWHWFLRVVNRCRR